MKTNNTNKYALHGRLLHAAGLAMLASGIGAFYVLFYLPLQASREDHRYRIDQISNLLEESGALQETHRELRTKRNRLRKLITETRERIPQEPTELKFMDQLSDIAKSVGIQDIDCQQGTLRPLPSHSETTIIFRGIGSYASVCQFLERVRQLARITKISKLDIEVEGQSNGYPIQATFVLYSGVESHDI